LCAAYDGDRTLVLGVRKMTLLEMRHLIESNLQWYDPFLLAAAALLTFYLGIIVGERRLK